MLTPQDIHDKEFGKAVFGGYDMPSVDDFLEELTDDYAALYKENATLKSKMKVLVEKIEEYRSTEDAMRLALVTAQKTGNDITREATEKSEALLSDAEEKSRVMLEEATEKSTKMVAEAEEKSRVMIEKAEVIAKSKVADLVELTKFENERLEKAMENSRQYLEASKKMAEKQLQFLETLETIKAEPVEIPEYNFLETEDEYDDETYEETDGAAEDAENAGDREAEILDTAKQIDANMSSMLNTTPKIPNSSGKKRKKGKEIDWEDDDEPTSPRPKFDFTDLKFGKNFDLEDK